MHEVFFFNIKTFSLQDVKTLSLNMKLKEEQEKTFYLPAAYGDLQKTNGALK